MIELVHGDITEQRVDAIVNAANSELAHASAYRSSLRVAAELGAALIAFPSISTGIYGYPIDAAAKVAIGALDAGAAEPGAPATIRVCLFSGADLATYERARAAAGD